MHRTCFNIKHTHVHSRQTKSIEHFILTALHFFTIYIQLRDRRACPCRAMLILLCSRRTAEFGFMRPYSAAYKQATMRQSATAYRKTHRINSSSPLIRTVHTTDRNDIDTRFSSISVSLSICPFSLSEFSNLLFIFCLSRIMCSPVKCGILCGLE